MIVEVTLGMLAALAVAQGTRLALRNAPKASSWAAAGTALLLLLSTRFPDSFEVTVGILMLAGVGVSGAGALLAREIALARERRMSRDLADDALVREVLHDVQEEEGIRLPAPPDPGQEA